MTQHSDPHDQRCMPPEIDSQEDAPFDPDPIRDIDPGAGSDQQKDVSLSKEKRPKETMDLKKFGLGSATLGWCIFLMFLCIILSLWFPEHELVKNGFEAFKLIVMTILGYIFGSNNTKSN